MPLAWANEIKPNVALVEAKVNVPKADGKSTANDDIDPEFIGLPFAFSSETMSNAIGVAGLVKGAGQQQASLLGIAAGSFNDSYVGFVAANSYQIPLLGKQWLFSAELYAAELPEGVYFLDDQQTSSLQAGSNSSSEDSQIKTRGKERSARLFAKYVLPIAAGKEGAISTLLGEPQIKSMVNPLVSGVSSITLQPCYDARDLGQFNYLQRGNKAAGLSVEFRWDNRDSISSTLAGNTVEFDYNHGFKYDGLESWSTWRFQYAQFVQLPTMSLLNNHVLAFNAAIADTPTWNNVTDGKYHRPPEFAGVSLGGFHHLRGYSSQRFHGRSSVSYTAEYRVQPNWQPLESVFEGYYDVPWWQWVMFIEAGRVADEFNLSTLHKDMKFNVGLGARFEVEGVVIRTELAKGEEGSQFWVMVNQPF